MHSVYKIQYDTGKKTEVLSALDKWADNSITTAFQCLEGATQ